MSNDNDELESQIKKHPQRYLELPSDVKRTRPDLALFAILKSSGSICEEIYRSIPFRIRKEDRVQLAYATEGYSLAALTIDRSPSAYRWIPDEIKEDNWGLVNKALQIWDHTLSDVIIMNSSSSNNNNGSDHNNTLEELVLNSMPSTMALCLRYFWRHWPPWLDLWAVRHDSERKERNDTTNDEKPPRAQLMMMRAAIGGEEDDAPFVSEAQARRWYNMQNLMGYAMLPARYRDEYEALALDLLRKIKPPRDEFALALLPPRILLQHTEGWKRWIMQWDVELYCYLPESVREADEETAAYIFSFDSHTHTSYNVISQLFTYVPATLYLQHPEWADMVVDMRPLWYKRLPEAVRLAFPTLAARALLHESRIYASVPLAVREGNWELARLAVMRSVYNYAYVPNSMKNVHLASTAEDRDRILHLLSLFVQENGDMNYKRPLSLAEHRTAMAARGDPLSPPWGLQRVPSESVPAFLVHLYASGQHALLRDLNELQRARNMAASKHRTVQILLPHAKWTKKLGPDLTQQVLMPWTEHAFHEVEDHMHWGRDVLARMWYKLDFILFQFKVPSGTSYYYLLYDLYDNLHTLVYLFCDPGRAWNIVPFDNEEAPREGPLSELQERFRQEVARQVWEAIAALETIEEVFEEHFDTPLNNNNTATWNEILALKNVLQDQMRCPPPPPEDLQQVPASVRRYLDKPRTWEHSTAPDKEQETFWSEDNEPLLQALQQHTRVAAPAEFKDQ